ncbi:MAG: ClpXP protease specificity-enhancing factor SspB [Pseudomonadota bacterium]
MSDDLIRYDILTQEALRRVIRKVLEEVQRTGLPGEHHFFITFETGYPGVRLSARMRERYPEEMTIVIQHSYWNLEVDENCLEIDLSFDDIRERLRVPFASIRGFFDPAVKFGLQFDVEQQGAEDAVEEGDATPITKKKSENKKTGKTLAPAGKSEEEPDSSDAEEAEKPDSGGDVVSLDSFRKKK